MHIDHYHGGIFAVFNAGALRTVNLANSLAMAGHTVTIITGDRQMLEPEECRTRFGLHPLVEVCSGGAPLPATLVRHLPRRINPLARGIGRERAAELILLFGPSPTTFRRLSEHASERGLPLVADIDEWMGPRDFSRRSWLTLYPIRYERFMKNLPRLIRSAVAISTSMQEHLAKSGADVVVIPPLHEALPVSAEQPKRPSTKTRLLLPGVRRGGKGKDRWSIELVCEAVQISPRLADSISVDIVGGVEEAKIARLVSELARSVEVRDHGRVDWGRARQLLLESDWLVALRDPSVRRLRYAFPSKVTESLVAGTPVIANDYSDMRRYLEADQSGIVVKSLTGVAVAEALHDAVAQPLDRAAVSEAARQRYTPSAAAPYISAFLGRLSSVMPQTDGSRLQQ